MQHVSQLITQPSEKSEQQTSAHDSVRQLTDNQMRQVWERMARMYGHRWTSNYGVEDDGTWRKGLAGLTPEQIGAGLVKCLVRKPAPGEEDWPPTLNEFRARCNPDKTKKIHTAYRSLPKPKQDKDVIRKFLDNLHSLLGSGKQT